MDANTQYFGMPDSAQGAAPSALQALLAQFLMPQPGQGGADNNAMPNAAPNPMIMRDPGMSAGPQQPMPPTGPMIPPPPPAGQAGFPSLSPSPAMGALHQQITMPPPMQNLPPNRSAMPPTANGNVPAMPQMPTHKENHIIKIIGAIAGLMGGSGGQVAGSYLDAQKANDTQNYGRAMQQYQMQQQQDQRQQAQTQQQFENTQQQARSSDSLLDNLSGKDAGTQQSIVEGMTPQIMSAYGYTPDSIKAQFYNADGTFKPVGTGADAKADAATLRAQTTAQARLHQLDPAAQANIHDQMDKDTFESTYGLPYEGFRPGQDTRDVTGATSAQARAAAATATAQKGALSTLLTMTPSVQAALLFGTAPQAFEAKYGIPANAFQPGMTTKDANALAAIGERATASRLAAATQTSIANGRNAVTERGQDLAHGDRQAAFGVRKLAYASLNQYRMARLSMTPGGGVDGLKLQQIITDREKARTELMHLRDAGQKLAGNRHLSDPVMAAQADDIAAQTRQAQQDYNQLDHLYQTKLGGQEPPAARSFNIPGPTNPPMNGGNANNMPVPSRGGGRAPLAPNTPNGANAYAPAASLGALPPAPVTMQRGRAIASFPVFTNHAPVPTPRAASGTTTLTPTQRQGMSNAQFATYFAKRMAAKFGKH